MSSGESLADCAPPSMGRARGQRPLKVQVISRAAGILRLLETAREGLSLRAIATRLDLPRSTVQRIVDALRREDLLIAASPRARVRLGPALTRLALSVEMSTAAVAHPLMQQLAIELGETIDLSMLGSDHAVFIDRVPSADGARARAALAVHYPLQCTANGRAMLAELTDVEIMAKIGLSYEPRTQQSPTTFAALLTTLSTVRRTKIAYSCEENALGICGVGVALRDVHGNLLALSAPMPRERFEQQKSQVARRLLQAGRVLQRQLAAGPLP